MKIVWFKFILFLTLTFGWKNEKQPSGPIELDLEAGNLVLILKNNHYYFPYSGEFLCFVFCSHLKTNITFTNETKTTFTAFDNVRQTVGM